MAWLLGWLGTAVVFACSQPPNPHWWVAPFALVPWLAYSSNGRALALGGLAWGTVSGVGLGVWIAPGLQNLGAGGFAATLGLIAVAMLVTGVPGALYGCAAALSRRHRLGSGLFGVSVMGIDWARGLPELGLPWALLGHSQAAAPGVAQLAVVAGVPLISGLLAAMSFAMAEELRGQRHSRSCASIPWLFAYLALSGGALEASEFARGRDESTVELSALAVQSRLPLGDRWMGSMQTTNVAILGRQTLRALSEIDERPDLVIWPETSLTADLSEDDRAASALADWVNRFRAPLVLGGVGNGEMDGVYYNSALWIDEDGVVADRFDKTLTVAIVESAAETRLAKALQKSFVSVPGARFAVEGTREEPLRGDIAIAVAMCFEVIYPKLVAARVREEAAAIVNLANDSWYGSAVPGTQQLAYGRFRAIEQRRFLLRVADSGPSAVVDPFGRIVRQLDAGVADVLHARFYKPAPPTQLERAALLGLAALGAVTGLALAAALRRVLR